MAQSSIPNYNNYTIAQCQFLLPSTITVPSGNLVDLCVNLDPRTCTYSALDHVPTTGTLIAAVFLWANGSVNPQTAIAVTNGKITCSVMNISKNSITISAARFLLIYKN